MFRTMLAFTAFACAIPLGSVEAQGIFGRGLRGNGLAGSMRTAGPVTARRGWGGLDRRARIPRNYRSTYPSNSFGFGISVGGVPGYGYSAYASPGFGFYDPYRFDGYGYDPYRYGSFKAPDLLDDPYFRARHKFDSQFPGRYRTPLEMRPVAPSAAYQTPYRSATPYVDVYPDKNGPLRHVDVVGQLGISTKQLSRSLAYVQYSEAWREYLAPDQISGLISSGDSAALRQLLTHYDGVDGNPEMRAVYTARGFATTQLLLRKYVVRLNESDGPLLDEGRGRQPSGLDPPAIESLPIPEPQPSPELLPLGNGRT